MINTIVNVYFRNTENNMCWRVYTDNNRDLIIQFMEYEEDGSGWYNSERDVDYPAEVEKKIMHILALFKN